MYEVNKAEVCCAITEAGQTKILHSTRDWHSVYFSSKFQRFEVEVKSDLDSLFGGVVFSSSIDMNHAVFL